MKLFSEWLLRRFTENTDLMVSGPGVDKLLDAVSSMASRGAPNEYNDYGFNKQDWETFVRNRSYLSQSSIPANIVTTFLRMLSRYKNTQISNFEEINNLVSIDLRNANQQSGQVADDKIHIFNNEPLSYGKVKVFIPGGIDNSEVRSINKIIDEKFQSEGAEKEVDNYGKLGYPRWKRFQKDKSNPYYFWIHKSVLDPIIEFIKSKRNIETTSTPSNSIPASSALDQTNQSPEVSAKREDISILGTKKTQYGNKLQVTFNSFENSPWQDIKRANLSPKGMSYAVDEHEKGRKGIFLINIDDQNIFDQVKNIIATKGLDVTPLDNFATTHFGRINDQIAKQSSNPINFIDNDSNKMRIKINYSHPQINNEQGKKTFLNELIKYTFPEHQAQDKDQRGFASVYDVEGNYQQYANFGRLLSKFGYNVDHLREILNSKVSSNKIEKDKFFGQYDSGENYEAIEKAIDTHLPDSTYELYKQQKEGVAFLYGRHHAILGDETGFGKTVQLITAAALRMKKDLRPTLIIGLKETQQQWVDAIKSVIGESVANDISTDGTQPKQWTVLYYHNFSTGKNLEQVVEKCKQAGFGIAIIDELHKLKHEESKRSQNIAEVLENIPTVWGASATVSSNKPIDVKNQLRIIKHHLGKVKDGKFKQEFAGYTPTGYGGSYEPGPEKKTYESAERLNRWLNLSGLYVRRSKGDLREMPNLNREPVSPTDINQSEFEKKYLDKLKDYKKNEKGQALAVSKLLAARETVAQLKTDQTVSKVTTIVQNNMDNPASNYAASKVVVFTNFIESANQLVEKLTNAIKQIDPRFKVITFLASTKKNERARVKEVFTNDPNAKVLVMSMKMGGTGIDFPNAAQNMVINDFDWTPESAEQSEGRIYRINTNHPVNISYTIANGIDAKLFDKVQKKRELAAIVQKYRKEYHQKEEDSELLQKIISAQKEISALNTDIEKISGELPEAGRSFREFFNTQEGIKKYLFSA